MSARAPTEATTAGTITLSTLSFLLSLWSVKSPLIIDNAIVNHSCMWREIGEAQHAVCDAPDGNSPGAAALGVLLVATIAFGRVVRVEVDTVGVDTGLVFAIRGMSWLQQPRLPTHLPRSGVTRAASEARQ